MEFSNARYDDPGRNTFTLDVKTEQYGVIPFTYRTDGSEERPGTISEKVGIAFRNGEIEVEPYQQTERGKEEQEAVIRAERNRRLSETDYFMMEDYPASEEDKEAVKQYRQALRDITEQEEYPENISWPEKPNCVK